MSKTNNFENSFLLLIFNNTAIANIGNAGGLQPSSVAGSFFVSLHTADPGEAGDQTTSEATYTGYARIGIARSGAGWVVTGNSVSPAANIGDTTWDCTSGGPQVITHFGVGTASSGAGVLLYKGAISPTISVSSGVTPILTTASAITED